MKTLFPTIALTFLLFAEVQSQNPFYTFSVHNESYQLLTAGTLITNSFDQDAYQVTYLDGFKAYDMNLNKDFIIGKNGFVVNTNNNIDKSFAFDPFIADLKKHPVKQSEIRTLIYVNGVDSTIVVQWKDMGINGHPDADYINFQVHIHKQSQMVEFRFGPGHNSRGDSIAAEKGATSQVYLLSADFSQAYEALVLNGSAENPVAVSNPNGQESIGLPPQGTVYRFSKTQQTTGINEIVDQKTNFYPNPATDKLFIENSLLNDDSRFTISDLNGREIQSCKWDHDGIDISNINPGMYILTVKNENELRYLKFVKQ